MKYSNYRIIFNKDINKNSIINNILQIYIKEQENKIISEIKNIKKKLFDKKIEIIDIGNFKFSIFPIKTKILKEKIILIKSNENIKSNIINLKEINTKLCFIIVYSNNLNLQNSFENLIDTIYNKIEYYSNL